MRTLRPALYHMLTATPCTPHAHPRMSPRTSNTPNTRLHDVMTYCTVAFHLNYCSYCGLEGESLSLCSRCKQVGYCNRSCQKRDWADVHRDECKELIAEALAKRCECSVSAATITPKLPKEQMAIVNRTQARIDLARSVVRAKAGIGERDGARFDRRQMAIPSCQTMTNGIRCNRPASAPGRPCKTCAAGEVEAADTGKAATPPPPSTATATSTPAAASAVPTTDAAAVLATPVGASEIPRLRRAFECKLAWSSGDGTDGDGK